MSRKDLDRYRPPQGDIFRAGDLVVEVEDFEKVFHEASPNVGVVEIRSSERADSLPYPLERFGVDIMHENGTIYLTIYCGVDEGAPDDSLAEIVPSTLSKLKQKIDQFLSDTSGENSIAFTDKKDVRITFADMPEIAFRVRPGHPGDFYEFELRDSGEGWPQSHNIERRHFRRLLEVANIYLSHAVQNKEGVSAEAVLGSEIQRDGSDNSVVRTETTGENSLNNIAGLRDVKDKLADIVVALAHPEIFEKWRSRPPGGILLYGPAGTGKNTIVKAIARESKSTLIEKRSDEIIEMWVGKSAKNLKAVFDEVKELEGSVILFFDEFDGLVSDTGNAEVQNSIIATLKTEIESIHESHPNVLIIAATNNEGILDSALMRSGRFDEKIYIPLPDKEGRKEMFAIELATGFSIDAEFQPFDSRIDIAMLVDQSEGMSCADIKELMRRLRFTHAAREVRTKKVTLITQEDIIKAINNFYR